jgi:hypothetical protein
MTASLVHYDAMDSSGSLFDLNEQQPSLSGIDLNRVGSVWVHRRDQTHWVWRGCWWEQAAADDLGPLLDRLCAHTALPSSEYLPESTRAVVAYRVIAAFLTHQILSPGRWTCRNGHLDSSDEGGRRDELFERFPEARERLRHADISDLFGQPAYRFWFLLKDDDPGLAVEPSSGLAWDTKGAGSILIAGIRGRTRSGRPCGQRRDTFCPDAFRQSHPTRSALRSRLHHRPGTRGGLAWLLLT